MTTFTAPKRISPYKSTNFEKTLVLNQKRKKAKESLFWGALNVCFLSVILYDLSTACSDFEWYIQYCEFAAVVVLTLNTAGHIAKCLYYNMTMESAAKERPPEVIGRVETSTPNRSGWRSDGSANYSLSSSWIYCRSPAALPLNSSLNESRSEGRRNVSGVDAIDDEESLGRYLHDYELHEKNRSAGSFQGDSSQSFLSSFWSHPASKSSKDASPMLRRCQYQLATPGSNTSSTGSPKSDDRTVSSAQMSQSLEMWRRLNVNSAAIVQWNENLRIWISQTILERLVKEFAAIDESLHRHGFSDVKVGGVGLDRLRKTAQTSPVLQFIPSLSVVLPFLELSTNQEYLVKRVRELARGGCMSEFKWNGGSAHNGKDWDISLPTDSAIVMHLFASYLDTQLLPQPNKPNEKPFSGFHYFKATDKAVPVNSTTLAVQEVAENPPHYRVIVAEEIFEVVKGYNNLFHSILLFLYFVNKKEHGMLGMVNMGKSGINILWIIDS